MNKKLLILSLVCFFGSSVYAEMLIEEGQIWQLESRSSGASFVGSKSEVLYRLRSDAFHTMRARKFDEWDLFARVDSRDLLRLKRGNEIKILNLMHSDEIARVELLDGKEQGKYFFVIVDDVFKKFSLLEKDETKES